MTDDTAGAPAAIATVDLTPGDWVLDPTRSSISIEHTGMWGLAKVKGVFTEFRGEAMVSPAGSVRGTVRIYTGSIDTENAKRDTHLRSADFFDAENHPSITFNATSALSESSGSISIRGELTVLDTTRPLSFTAQISELTAAALTLTANIPISRTDFGVSWNKLGMLKPVTLVTVTARFARQPR